MKKKLNADAIDALKRVVMDELELVDVNDATLIYADGDAPLVGPIEDKMIYLFNIIYDVEELFQIVIPDDALNALKTFSDLVHVVETTLGKIGYHR